MLTLIFENSSQEEALKLRDFLCEALVGIPGFIDNDIVVNTQDLDSITKEPLNEEGDLVTVDDDGIKHEHCIRLIISSDNQPEEVTNHIIVLGGKELLEKNNIIKQ